MRNTKNTLRRSLKGSLAIPFVLTAAMSPSDAQAEPPASQVISRNPPARPVTPVTAPATDKGAATPPVAPTDPPPEVIHRNPPNPTFHRNPPRQNLNPPAKPKYPVPTNPPPAQRQPTPDDLPGARGQPVGVRDLPPPVPKPRPPATIPPPTNPPAPPVAPSNPPAPPVAPTNNPPPPRQPPTVG